MSSKYECPDCCGEGYDIDIIIDSDFPALFMCDMCDGDGYVEEAIYCRSCKRYISGPEIDLDDEEYEEILHFTRCLNCPLTAEQICEVQPMTGTTSYIAYTTTATSSSTLTFNDGSWNNLSP